MHEKSLQFPHNRGGTKLRFYRKHGNIFSKMVPNIKRMLELPIANKGY